MLWTFMVLQVVCVCVTYVRLVVVGSTLADLRGQVVRSPNAGPGQLHGAAETQHTLTGVTM